ncbi:MAG: hypothetical protein ABIF77_19130, partial [bacterium]
RELEASEPSPESNPRLAEVQERLTETRRRLGEVEVEIMTARAKLVSEKDLRRALREFDGLWGELSPTERARVVHALVERVVYDREKGELAITYRPTGIRSLTKDAAL